MTIPAILLAIFLAEVSSAGVSPWTNQLHAQITTESAWRPNACSIYACGLAQFTLPTWGDFAPYTSPSCEGVVREDPACSVRAQIVYMRRLLRRYREVDSNRQRWMFSWAAYNGGPGWITKERKRCRAKIGCSEELWEDNVEDLCIRAAWACKENRLYPKKILREINKLNGKRH